MATLQTRYDRSGEIIHSHIECVEAWEILKPLMSVFGSRPSRAGILELLVACHEACSRSNLIFMEFHFCTGYRF